jgi:flavin reductase
MTTPAELRWAVRQFASGVAVLTVGHGDQVHGTTVSALTAVSRQPLLIGACLRRDSAFGRLVNTRRGFAVNVLGTGQALLASWFANPDRPPGAAQFDDVDWEPDPATGAPLIRGSLARLGCRLFSCYPAGDHRLLLAEVVSGSVAEGAPLLSFAGRVHDDGTQLKGVLR